MNSISRVWPVKKLIPINLGTLYSSEARNAIDGSNRIMLIAGWRGKDAPDELFVILKKDRLEVCPPPVFEAFLEGLRNKTADKTLIPEMERQLTKRVRQVRLDSVGRLPLPREFTVQLGIEKQADLIGRFDKFEIWPPGKRDEPNSTSQAAADLLAKEME
jgi:DNA-binding transcriptional regulator/RsmH inhibitor MraZ